MYELLLNAAKVLISKDVRDAGKDLFKLVQTAPEWEKDICTLALRIDSGSREQTALIRELSAEKLRTLRYPDFVIEAFRGIYVELTTNALEYGLIDKWWRKGKIDIETVITDSYVALVVRNTKGVRFNLEKACKEQYRRLGDNPQSPRGRGLLKVRNLADELFSLEEGRTVKAVLYKGAVVIDYFCLEDVVVFSLVSGIYNPSLPSRLKLHIMNHPGHDIILDFSRFRGYSTDVGRQIILLRERLAQMNRRVVVISTGQRAVKPILDALCQSGIVTDVDRVVSWHEALEYLDRMHLLDELTRRKEEAVRLDF